MDEIFDDVKLNNLDKNIELLPYDIRYKIYKEYFDPNTIADKLCDNLYFELKSKECCILNIKNLKPIIEKILKNRLAISKLQKNDKIFNKLYNQIIVKQIHNFIHLSYNNDLALSWVMTLYH